MDVLYASNLDGRNWDHRCAYQGIRHRNRHGGYRLIDRIQSTDLIRVLRVQRELARIGVRNTQISSNDVGRVVMPRFAPPSGGIDVVGRIRIAIEVFVERDRFGSGTPRRVHCVERSDEGVVPAGVGVVEAGG